jgi:histidinol-phosphate/aromatic aminotransferase/cobyric acid decarboxylase-like protein
VAAQAAVCPVAVRRVGGEVIEVHLLPALEPGRAPWPLATLAEYAVASVLEAGGPVEARRRTVRARVGYGRSGP